MCISAQQHFFLYFIFFFAYHFSANIFLHENEISESKQTKKNAVNHLALLCMYEYDILMIDALKRINILMIGIFQQFQDRLNEITNA